MCNRISEPIVRFVKKYKTFELRHKRFLSQILALNKESQIKYHENRQPVVSKSAYVKHVIIAAVSIEA